MSNKQKMVLAVMAISFAFILLMSVSTYIFIWNMTNNTEQVQLQTVGANR